MNILALRVVSLSTILSIALFGCDSESDDDGTTGTGAGSGGTGQTTWESGS